MMDIYQEIKEEMKKVYLSRNCCFVGYSGGKDSSAMLTPAQQLGLTDKQFTLNDILYFK
nr:hypothetical protein [Bacillus sp. AFS014408]